MENRLSSLEMKMTQVELDIKSIRHDTETIVHIMRGAKAAATVADWIVKMAAGAGLVVMLAKWYGSI